MAIYNNDRDPNEIMWEEGQKVIYNNELRTIYSIYDDNMASLCLIDEEGFEYDDVEEDYQVSISKLKTI